MAISAGHFPRRLDGLPKICPTVEITGKRPAFLEKANKSFEEIERFWLGRVHNFDFRHSSDRVGLICLIGGTAYLRAFWRWPDAKAKYSGNCDYKPAISPILKNVIAHKLRLDNALEGRSMADVRDGTPAGDRFCVVISDGNEVDR